MRTAAFIFTDRVCHAEWKNIKQIYPRIDDNERRKYTVKIEVRIGPIHSTPALL